MSDFIKKLKKIWEKLVEQNKRGIKWVGIDGLINMETSALLTIFLMIFLNVLWAMALSMVVVLAKCYIDRKQGHENEKHDFICACIGVIVGAILGIAHCVVYVL